MPSITKLRTIVTQPNDGEMTIKLSIDLNININGVSVGGTVTENEDTPVPEKKRIEKDADWIVPEFTAVETVDFGKYAK